MRFDESKVTYEIELLEELDGVRGNVMASGDDEFNRQCENEILADLDRGNQWAWCTVKVTAKYDGLHHVEGTDYLGACSYHDEKQFKNDVYFEDMKAVALADLKLALEEIAEILA